MAYTIDQFGFEEIEQIPVKENDWAKMLETFIASDAKCIKKDFEASGKSASNAAGAIRKAAENLGIEVDVVTMESTVYVQKTVEPDFSVKG